jgi:hypothetical protein
MSIKFTDGKVVVVDRRERPSLVLDTNNNPLYLVTGVQTQAHDLSSCTSYTVFTELLPKGRRPATTPFAGG